MREGSADSWAWNPEPLPLYRKPDLGAVFDRQGFFDRRREGKAGRKAVDDWIEKVLPTGSRLRVRDRDDGIWCEIVECAYSPFAGGPLFALTASVTAARDGDSRTGAASPGQGLASRFDPEVILQCLRSRTGQPYLWGGTSTEGSPTQAAWLVSEGHFRAEDLDDEELSRVLLARGLDCSGLLNEALGYGFLGDCRHFADRGAGFYRQIPADAARRPERLAAMLRPLDLILYRGHVIVALGEGKVIQAVGEGPNAESFARATGFRGDPCEKYDGVVEDEAEAVLEALIRIQGRHFTEEALGGAESAAILDLPSLARSGRLDPTSGA